MRIGSIFLDRGPGRLTFDAGTLVLLLRTLVFGVCTLWAQVLISKAGFDSVITGGLDDFFVDVMTNCSRPFCEQSFFGA